MIKSHICITAVITALFVLLTASVTLNYFFYSGKLHIETAADRMVNEAADAFSAVHEKVKVQK